MTEFKEVMDLPFILRQKMYDSVEGADFNSIKKDMDKAKEEGQDIGGFVFKSDNGMVYVTNGEQVAFIFKISGEDGEIKKFSASLGVDQIESLLEPGNNPGNNDIYTIIEEDLDG